MWDGLDNDRRRAVIDALMTITLYSPGRGARVFDPFWLYEMPDPYPDVAYVDNLAGAVYVEDDTAVERFRQAYDQLSAMALAGKESAALIAAAAKEL